MTELDAFDRALLERMQSGFPLTTSPFAVLGEAVGLDEDEVLERVRSLKHAQIIRQIGAIFDTRRLGYQSTLVAFHVDDEALEAVAAQVSAHPGVSHNYARPHHYNLWFTLAVPPGRAVLQEIGHLAERTGTDDWLDLPATRMFKLRTHFRLGGSSSPPAKERSHKAAPSRAFAQDDVPLVRALQADLPITSHPFAEAARRLGLGEKDLIERARELERAGIMRRYSAVLRHRRVGYRANGMACWVVPEGQIEAAGQRAAAFPAVSHCYQRPAYPPRWPYSLFTMVHGQTRDEVEAVVAEIARDLAAIMRETEIEEYQVLYSTREFKKERVRYFEEER